MAMLMKAAKAELYASPVIRVERDVLVHALESPGRWRRLIVNEHILHEYVSVSPDDPLPAYVALASHCRLQSYYIFISIYMYGDNSKV
jgi:hypothetical protein